MGSGVGRSDLATQRMADYVNAVVVEPHPQRLEIVDEVVQRVRNRRDRAFAMAS